MHDMNAMDMIPYEESSFYIFDRGYNDFKRLHNIESIGAYFVATGRNSRLARNLRLMRQVAHPVLQRITKTGAPNPQAPIVYAAFRYLRTKSSSMTILLPFSPLPCLSNHGGQPECGHNPPPR